MAGTDALSAGPLEDAAADSLARRAGLLAVSCLLIAVPLLFVHFPPITDLPQHLAQIRLLNETLAAPDSPYRIQWLTPYVLAYAPLALAWLVSPSESAGPLAVLMLALGWTLAIHGLALARARPAASAVLATALFYNHTTYWGFYSFEVGWPVFALWLCVTTRRRSGPWRLADTALLLATAALLYLSHALWFAAGLAWLLLRGAAARTPARLVLAEIGSVAPVLVMAALWYPSLSAAGFSSPTRWLALPSARLSFSWLVDAVLGGIRGPVEYAMIGVLVAWVALGIRGAKGRPGPLADRDLCLAAGFFLVLALVLPSLHQNTIGFASRWVPPAAILFLLGMPAPRLAGARREIAALAVVAAFVVATGLAWARFEANELSGLPASLDALPPATRVIGLDYVKVSPVIKGRPFLQDFAYAQVARGATLNFSFAEFAPMVVVYRSPRRPAWTHGLEWEPERLRPSDWGYFDYALVNAEDPQHAALATLPELTPVTPDGRWRLYRIRTAAR